MNTSFFTLRTSIFCLAASLLPALPALAHNPSLPLDAATQYMSDLAISGATVALLGIAAYFAIGALVSQYERRRKLSLDEKTVKAGTFLTTAGVILLLWRLAAPAPLAVASSGNGHQDTPQHGGQIVSAGDNHLEAVVGPSGSVTLYVMGITGTIPFPLAQKTLWGKASAPGAGLSPVMLHAAPLAGEPKGQSSVFAGEVPAGLAGKPFHLTVSVPLSGQEQPIAFDLGPNGGASLAAAPVHDTSAVRVVAAPITPAERDLFLKPGGAYTAADIAANGSTTPDQKFQGLMANHHLNPKKGTYTCPITKTQANSKFSWIVGGKKYLFCCPPCVTEFVKQAKADPKSIKMPTAYIQQ